MITQCNSSYRYLMLECIFSVVSKKSSRSSFACFALKRCSSCKKTEYQLICRWINFCKPNAHHSLTSDFTTDTSTGKAISEPWAAQTWYTLTQVSKASPLHNELWLWVLEKVPFIQHNVLTKWVPYIVNNQTIHCAPMHTRYTFSSFARWIL